MIFYVSSFHNHHEFIIGSTKRVTPDRVTKFKEQITSHPNVTEPRTIFKINKHVTSYSSVTDPRRMTNSSTRQTNFIRTTKHTQDSNLNRQNIQSAGKLFIISAITQI